MIPVVGTIFAIGLPAFALWRNEKAPLRRPYLFSIASFVFCAAAVIQELFTVKRRALAGDFGGIMDTIDAVLIICIGVVAVTVTVNLLLLGITWEEKRSG